MIKPYIQSLAIAQALSPSHCLCELPFQYSSFPSINKDQGGKKKKKGAGNLHAGLSACLSEMVSLSQSSLQIKKKKINYEENTHKPQNTLAGSMENRRELFVFTVACLEENRQLELACCLLTLVSFTPAHFS